LFHIKIGASEAVAVARVEAVRDDVDVEAGKVGAMVVLLRVEAMV
jgi:hypothetical protein